MTPDRPALDLTAGRSRKSYDLHLRLASSGATTGQEPTDRATIGRVDDQRARDALTAERDATQARLQALTADLHAVVGAATGSNLDDEHDPEGATIAFERQQLAALRDQARSQLAEIDSAFERLAAGRYGTCQSCGGPIGDERLAARPYVRTCVTCSARAR